MKLRYNIFPPSLLGSVGLGLLFFLFSCEKEELPVPKHSPGNVITATVDMESNYKWQLFYSLKNNAVVSKNLKTIWDIGFETSADGYRIIINSAKFMFVSNMGNVSFNAVTDTSGFEANKKWDEASGNLDSTAIGDWRNKNNVYLISRGYDELGVHLGFKKMQIQSQNQN